MSRRNGEWGWNDVEELLQCPVCLDVPNANSMVEQCRNGHHICATCKPQVNECPICKCSFYGTRNFVVEELVNHYEILKNLLLLTALDDPEKQNSIKSKIKSIPVRPKAVVKRKLDTPQSSRGTFPCRAEGCDKLFPNCRLVNHVRSAHPNVFSEGVIGDNGVFSGEFEILYPVKEYVKPSVHIFSIKGIGLVFVNIEVLQSGDFLAFLRMGTPLSQSSKFIACLELKNPVNNVSYDYKQQLISVRESVIGMFQKKFAFMLDKTLCKRVCSSGKIKCTLTVKLYSELRDRTSLTPVDAFNLNVVAAVRASLIELKLKQKTIKNSKNPNTNNNNNNNGAIKKILSNNQSAPRVGVSASGFAAALEVLQQSTTSTAPSGGQNKSKKQKKKRR